MSFNHKKFGPTRAGHILRLWVCAGLLGLVAVAVATQGLGSLVVMEFLVFVGGGAVWVAATSILRLRRGEYLGADDDTAP